MSENKTSQNHPNSADQSQAAAAADKAAADKAAADKAAADKAAADKAAADKAAAAKAAADKATADKTAAANAQERKDLKALAERNGQPIKEAYKTADGFVFLQRGFALDHSRTLKDKTITIITV